VTLLLKNGAKIDEQVPRVFQADAGRTALMAAAQAGRAETVRVLLAAGANPRLAAADGRTALAIARDARNSDVAALLQ
jgi:ankyrin repeat protein